jgi:TonB family protein
VVLHAIIGRDGTVQNLLVTSGNELLAQAAVDAVKQWTYRPYLLNGVATEVDTTVTVNFRLGPGPSAPSTPPSPSSSMPSGPVRVSGGVMAGMILHRVPLAYPEEAKARGIQGRVVLRAIIGKDGRVIHLQAISGDPSLQQSALDAVKDWVYRPYLLNGEPIEVDTNITCDFTISG